MSQNYINHVAFIIDSSSSMRPLSNDVIKVVDNQIANLATLSKNVDQETRISVYTFNNNVENLIFDKDVLRLPSIKSLYKTGGMTALIDGTLKGIDDLLTTSQIYGDHSFLLFIITDGAENASKDARKLKLKSIISNLPDNWTVAAFVPNQLSKFEAQKYGFPVDNISIWTTDAKGMEEADKKITQATQSYFTQRSQGVKSFKNLFTLDTSNLNKSTVTKQLDKLSTSDYRLYHVGYESPIKDFIEATTKKSYTLGSAYYQLTKPEKIQASKSICIQDKKDGKVYFGVKARDLLGLPNMEVKVSPDNHSSYNIFVQSTSVNRKLMSGTQVLLML